MGHKKVCLSCRLCLNMDSNYNPELVYHCPQCGKNMKLLTHRFRPPKKSENRAWQLVEFLIDNGFPFQHIYQVGKSEYFKTPYNNYAPYPKSILEAKDFIEKYKDQAKKPKP